MNMDRSEIDVIDLVPIITEIICAYRDASYTERKAIVCKIRTTFEPKLASIIEWVACVLATPNQTAQIIELLACALCGFGVPLAKAQNRQKLHQMQQLGEIKTDKFIE
jgi:hypothetical protein